MQALKPFGDEAEQAGTFLAASTDAARQYYAAYKLDSGPGGAAIRPLKDAQDTALSQRKRLKAIQSLAGIRGGKPDKGVVVFERVCAGCHQLGAKGTAFGPKLDGIGARYPKQDLMMHILWPNEKIAKGFETVLVLTSEGKTLTGFILDENDEALTLGVATPDGKGLRVVIPQSDIEARQDMKASSMPEGLAKTIAPSEFLDLVEFLGEQLVGVDGWIETGLADRGKLRRQGEFVEISRDAQLQLGPGFAGPWSRDASLLLSAADPDQREFAFHSPNASTSHPAVVIRLAEPAEIRHIEIQNRRNPKFHARARDLAVWVSDDGQSWQQVWKSAQPSGEYAIELPAGTRGQYLKVGLEGEGILHLNQIVVYGPR